MVCGLLPDCVFYWVCVCAGNAGAYQRASETHLCGRDDRLHSTDASSGPWDEQHYSRPRPGRAHSPQPTTQGPHDSELTGHYYHGIDPLLVMHRLHLVQSETDIFFLNSARPNFFINRYMCSVELPSLLNFFPYVKLAVVQGLVYTLSLWITSLVFQPNCPDYSKYGQEDLIYSTYTVQLIYNYTALFQ